MAEDDGDRSGGVDGDGSGVVDRAGERAVPAEVVPAEPVAGPIARPAAWNFPVEVEVVGRLSDEHLRTVARHVFDELDVALRSVGRA